MKMLAYITSIIDRTGEHVSCWCYVVILAGWIHIPLFTPDHTLCRSNHSITGASLVWYLGAYALKCSGYRIH
jgi:hypothetical protein